MELGFGEPQDWFPEEADAIDATRQLYSILKDMVQRGCQVEVLDCWSGDENNDALQLDICLSQVLADYFRLFEGHLFTLRS